MAPMRNGLAQGARLVLLLLVSGLASSCGSRYEEPAETATLQPAARRFWELHDKAKDLYVAEDFSAASAAYKQALELNPRHTASLYNLANSELHLGHHAAALEYLHRLEAEDPYETKPKLLAAAILSDPAPDGPFDLVAAHERFSMEHDVSYLTWSWDPKRQTTTVKERVEENHDRTRTTGLQLTFTAPVGATWRAGPIFTVNRKIEDRKSVV